MKKFNNIYKYIYAITVVFIFWYLLHIILNSFVIPNPIEVISRLFKVGYSIISTHLIASLLRLLIALLITTILGYSIGILIGVNDKLDNLISPIVYLFFPVPRIAFLPVFMILFGLGNTSKIVLIVAIAIFQIIISVRDGAKEISKELILSAKSLRVFKVSNDETHLYSSNFTKVIYSYENSIRFQHGSPVFCRKLCHKVWYRILYYEFLG